MGRIRVNRRDMIKTSLAAGILSSTNPAEANASAEGSHFYELRTYELRNDIQPGRIQEFFQSHFMPAMNRHGIGPIGCFNVIMGLSSPWLVVVIDLKSLADLQASGERVNADKDFLKAWQSFEATGELPYVCYQSVLLRAFDSHPR